MIAEAFTEIRYPILPDVERKPGRAHAESMYSRREILHIRHHSLYTPRDFDLSPFFQIVKPTLAFGFDYTTLRWANAEYGARAELQPSQPSPAERTDSE